MIALLLVPVIAAVAVMIQNKYEQGFWLGHWSYLRSLRKKGL